MEELSEQDRGVIRRLRQEGCAVVVFLPEEIRDASSEDVEDRMIEAGWNCIGGRDGEVVPRYEMWKTAPFAWGE